MPLKPSEAAPLIATLMAEEMGKDEGWIKEQINNFNEVAKNYKPPFNQPGAKL